MKYPAAHAEQTPPEAVVQNLVLAALLAQTPLKGAWLGSLHLEQYFVPPIASPHSAHPSAPTVHSATHWPPSSSFVSSAYLSIRPAGQAVHFSAPAALHSAHEGSEEASSYQSKLREI